MPRLTDKAITDAVARNAKPGAKRYDVFDAKLRGFGLRVDLPSFLPVEVLPDASPGAAMANGDAVASDSRIEITLSNGLSLCVSGGFDPDAVSRLIRGLAP